ncbi:hypothetical protein CDD83_65 [Cordyceps sp. RAO-2017]|nr:hypothetical protein CDD83_65 [Cordyceps sp. RAO-2017]
MAAAPARFRPNDFGSSPLSIPVHDSSRADAPPPPLPPPRYPLGDAAQPSDDIKRDHRSHASSSFASGYGSMGSSYADERPNFKRRDTGSTTNGDEGYSSYASTERSRESLQTDIALQHHSKFFFQTPADLYTDTMKRRLDSVRPMDRSPPSLLSASLSDARRHAEPRHPPMPSVQLPYHTRADAHRLLPDASDLDRSPRGRSRRNNSDDATSTQGSFDYTGAEDMEMDDAHAAVGQKRRAASPLPSDEMLLNTVSGSHSDVVRRRDVASRGSPTPRLAAIAQPSPASSSLPPPAVSRPGSYMPAVSMPPSVMTPASSYGRRSPGGTSPGGISPTCSSPYTTPASLTHSPRSSVAARASVHGRAASGTSPRKLDVQKPGGSKLQGFHMCECCPKKPKKFDTAEELRAHEAEKQYECLFCGNRFKNKNEAERHQNSLHVRRHSWSCSALSGYDRAFHDSTNRPGEADTCGYCGDEFPRSGRVPGTGALSGGIVPRLATEQDWEERIRHLQDVHKFRECNAAKKFYRADHFRQHLKHSHAGTSGKWTNMLENACMMEEDPSPR